MLRKLIATTAVLAVTGAAFAQSVLSFEEVPSAVANLFVIDISQTVPSGDNWTTAGFAATASNGATFRYATDPNTGLDSIITPDVHSGQDTADAARHVTFISLPRGQAQNSRFRGGGKPAFIGAYDPTGAVPDFTSTFANIAIADTPPLGEGSGYVGRIAINVGGTAFTVAELDIVFSDPGASAVLSGIYAASSVNDAALVNTNFWVVPEPASLALLVIGGLIASRRR